MQQSVFVYYTNLKLFGMNSHPTMKYYPAHVVEKLRQKDEKEKVMRFLMGLNDSYVAIRGQILLMQPLPNTRRVYSLILQQEKQVEVSLHDRNVKHHSILAE